MQTMYLMYFLFTTTNAYSNFFFFHVYHEFFMEFLISLPITFNLVHKCTRELIKEVCE